MIRSAAFSDIEIPIRRNEMRNKSNKKIRLFGIIALLLVCSLLLSSCSKKFVSDGADYKDKKTNVTYAYAPFCYEAIAISDEEYAKTGNSVFYAIEGQDPLKWLCESSGTVFYSKSLTLPTLDKMNISYIDICAETASVTVKSTITDGGDIAAIISSYVSEAPLTYFGDVASSSYKIRFADTSLGLYYSVSFFAYSDGSAYLFNRSENRFVKAPAELLNYINALG